MLASFEQALMKQNFCLDKVGDEEIVKESCKQTQEALFSSLRPDEMKQVLKDVSDGILSEVKVRVYISLTMQCMSR